MYTHNVVHGTQHKRSEAKARANRGDCKLLENKTEKPILRSYLCTLHQTVVFLSLAAVDLTNAYTYTHDVWGISFCVCATATACLRTNLCKHFIWWNIYFWISWIAFFACRLGNVRQMCHVRVFHSNVLVSRMFAGVFHFHRNIFLFFINFCVFPFLLVNNHRVYF